MTPLTTHALDTSIGRPASGLRVALRRRGSDGTWIDIARGTTDADGRLTDLVDGPLVAGTYRLIFDTGEYFERRSVATFYPHVEITFTIADPGEHYHVPLLLSPYGFSTYRGS